MLIRGLLGCDIEFDGAQVYVVLRRKLFCGFNLVCIAAGCLAHARVNDTPGFTQGAGGESTETTRCSRNNDYVLRFNSPDRQRTRHDSGSEP